MERMARWGLAIFGVLVFTQVVVGTVLVVAELSARALRERKC